MGESGNACVVPMMRWLYVCCMVLLQPLLRRKLRRRALAEPGYGVAVEERFGTYTQPCEAQQAQSEYRFIWVHAVSLGETRAAASKVLSCCSLVMCRSGSPGIHPQQQGAS